jgi:hypothetical protein
MSYQMIQNKKNGWMMSTYRHSVSRLAASPGATARMLCLMAESLPVGAQLDLIVSTPVVLQALDCCAGILSHGWDIDTYCKDLEWKDVMVLWKNRQLHESVREVDENGLDAENSTFLKLAVDETIQGVRETAEGGRLSQWR